MYSTALCVFSISLRYTLFFRVATLFLQRQLATMALRWFVVLVFDHIFKNIFICCRLAARSFAACVYISDYSLPSIIGHFLANVVKLALFFRPSWTCRSVGCFVSFQTLTVLINSCARQEVSNVSLRSVTMFVCVCCCTYSFPCLVRLLGCNPYWLQQQLVWVSNFLILFKFIFDWNSIFCVPINLPLDIHNCHLSLNWWWTRSSRSNSLLDMIACLSYCGVDTDGCVFASLFKICISCLLLLCAIWIAVLISWMLSQHCWPFFKVCFQISGHHSHTVLLLCDWICFFPYCCCRVGTGSWMGLWSHSGCSTSFARSG